MENELYRHVIKSAVDSEDGESPTVVLVTKETNGWCVWVDGFNGSGIIGFFRFSRDQAIEKAVSYSSKSEEELYSLAQITL